MDRKVSEDLYDKLHKIRSTSILKDNGNPELAEGWNASVNRADRRPAANQFTN